MNLFQVTKKQEGGGLALQTFTGNPVTFTPSYSEELPAPFNGTNLKVNIVASGGNGTPSTPIPIVGHSELNLVRCGSNIWNEETESGYINSSTGAEVSDPSKIRMKNYVRVSANSTYFYKTPVAFYICCYDASKTFIGRVGGSRNTTFTTPANCAYIRCGFESAYGTTYNHDISINNPSTNTNYNAYNGTPYLVQFGQTVYGGVYDKSGRLTITHGIVDLGTLDYGYSAPRFTYIFVSGLYPTPFSDVANAKCSIYTCKSRSEIEQFDNAFSLSAGGDGTVVLNITDSRFTDGASLKTALSGVMLAYELATPIEIDVSELSVDTIVGVNNIVSDCGGDITITCLI